MRTERTRDATIPVKKACGRAIRTEKVVVAREKEIPAASRVCFISGEALATACRDVPREAPFPPV